MSWIVNNGWQTYVMHRYKVKHAYNKNSMLGFMCNCLYTHLWFEFALSYDFDSHTITNDIKSTLWAQLVSKADDLHFRHAFK